jgi:hypothetical protein
VVAECWVCTGKDCSRAKGHRALLDEASAVADVHLVRCQKVCEGPVLGVRVGGRIEWFERIRGEKSRRAGLRLVTTGGPLPERLARRRSRKRSGQLRT